MRYVRQATIGHLLCASPNRKRTGMGDGTGTQLFLAAQPFPIPTRE